MTCVLNPYTKNPGNTGPSNKFSEERESISTGAQLNNNVPSSKAINRDIFCSSFRRELNSRPCVAVTHTAG